MKDYKVLSSLTIEMLSKFINMQLERGYLLSGGVTFGLGMFHQAIYKPIKTT